MDIYLFLFFNIDYYNQINSNIVFNVLDIIKKQFNIFKYNIKNKCIIIINIVILFNSFIIFYLNIFNKRFAKEFIGFIINFIIIIIFINIIIFFISLNTCIQSFTYITFITNLKTFIKVMKSNSNKNYKNYITFDKPYSILSKKTFYNSKSKRSFISIYL